MKSNNFIYIMVTILVLVLINTYVTIRNKYTNNTIQKELESINQENTDMKIDLDITKKIEFMNYFLTEKYWTKI